MSDRGPARVKLEVFSTESVWDASQRRAVEDYLAWLDTRPGSCWDEAGRLFVAAYLSSGGRRVVLQCIVKQAGVRDPDDVEEVVQRFVTDTQRLARKFDPQKAEREGRTGSENRAARGGSGGPAGLRLFSWAITKVHWAAMTWLREQRRFVPLEEGVRGPDGDEADDVVYDLEGPVLVVIDPACGERYKDLHRCLRELPALDRTIVYYYYFAKRRRNAKEIADLLGMTHAAVRQRLARARMQLKDCLCRSRCRYSVVSEV